MLGVAIFFQRQRKLIVRSAALLALCCAGLLAILPRADAHDGAVKKVDAKAYLLSPHSLSGTHFATLYPLTHR